MCSKRSDEAGRISQGRFRWWWRLGKAAVAWVVLTWISFALAVRLVPMPPALWAPPPAATYIVDRHGKPLRTATTENADFSQPVAYGQFPRVLVEATLAAEDKRFWEHRGVDGAGTGRAGWELVRHRRIVSGGSTITQQLIKLVQPRRRAIRAKILEILQARRVEQLWSKERILREYLNRLEYGNLCRGPADAAQFYFGKPLQDISPAEAAFLAGLPQAPGRLNPHRSFERAQARQRWVIGRMAALDFLTSDEAQRALAEELRLRPARRPFAAPHFVDLLLQQHSSDMARLDTPRWETALDLELNNVVLNAMHEHLRELEERHVLNGAAVVLDNRSGDVLALVGSQNFFAPESGQVNGAWALRSPGSALKPFTYLLAFERGANPVTVVADVPVDFPTPSGIFTPVNYDRSCRGPVNYRMALANSLNIPAVRILEQAGGPSALQQRLQQFGLTSLSATPTHYGLGLTLGNAEVRLLELANAYASLARLGNYMPYQLSRDPFLRAQRPSSVTRVADAGACYLVADILSDNRARALAFGTDSSLRFDFPVACKTGTSTDFRDNWAFGYTPEFTVGVWVGNFDGSPMQGISGVTGAGPILHTIVEHLHDRFGTSWYAPPVDLVECDVDALTGKRLMGPTAKSVREKCLASHLPAMARSDDYDSAGRVRLGDEYRDWFRSAENWLGDCAVCEAGSRVTPGEGTAGPLRGGVMTKRGDEAVPSPELRLVSPLPGTVFFLDPDLAQGGRVLPLQADGTGEIIWESETLHCRRVGGRFIAYLTPGRHRLTARTGEDTRQETWIEVKNL